MTFGGLMRMVLRGSVPFSKSTLLLNKASKGGDLNDVHPSLFVMKMKLDQSRNCISLIFSQAPRVKSGNSTALFPRAMDSPERAEIALQVAAS